MIIVHHLENSRSQRILWLLEELGLSYEIKFYKRHPETMLAPPELLKIHPLGKSPVLTDDGLVVAESGAIVEYLLEKYDSKNLKGSDPLRFRYWLHYAEGSLMPPLLLHLIFGRLGKSPMPLFLRPAGALISFGFMKRFLEPQLKMHLKFINSELEKSPYLAGENFSAADVQMSFPLEAAQARVGFEKYPTLQKYIDKIKARPAYAIALEKGGPFTILDS